MICLLFLPVGCLTLERVKQLEFLLRTLLSSAQYIFKNAILNDFITLLMTQKSSQNAVQFHSDKLALQGNRCLPYFSLS